jgi:hypothetical protein
VTTLVIQHPVRNGFEGWKSVFDSDPVGRASSGMTRHTIYRDADNPDYTVVRTEFPSREQAEALVNALRERWAVMGEKVGFSYPDEVQVRFLDEVEQVDY